MTGSSTENIVDFTADRERRQTETMDCPEPPQETVDIFSMAFFGFWPGIVWLPLPSMRATSRAVAAETAVTRAFLKATTVVVNQVERYWRNP